MKYFYITYKGCFETLVKVHTHEDHASASEHRASDTGGDPAVGGVVLGDGEDFKGITTASMINLYNALAVGDERIIKEFHTKKEGGEALLQRLQLRYGNQPVAEYTAVPATGNQPTEPQEGETEMAVAKKAAKKTPKKDTGDKKPGVIDTIATVLQDGGGTVEQIAAKVAKKFPDRNVESITSTVKIQVSRLARPKDQGGRSLKVKDEKLEGTNEKKYWV